MATILVRRFRSNRAISGPENLAETTIQAPFNPFNQDLKTHGAQCLSGSCQENSRLPRHPIYPTLGLTGEAGEVADKVKKVLRDRNGVFDAETSAAIKLELGDVFWYVAQLSMELGYDLEEVAVANLNKLSSRASRGRIAGSGDHR